MPLALDSEEGDIENYRQLWMMAQDGLVVSKDNSLEQAHEYNSQISVIETVSV